MPKIDFKKTLKELYAPPTTEFVEVKVPRMQFFKVDGAGNPNTSASYKLAVEALYGVSYATKFDAKNRLGQDYVVPPLEGLWWADDPEAFTARRKNEWRWTMMIMAPEFVTPEIFQTAATKTRKKAGALPETLRLEPLEEGLCLQIMHIGSYDDEGPILTRLHDEIMPARRLTFNGPHHEIYLSDPRRTASEKLKTILRQPIQPAT